jgi:integrative and conjugative element protein (TIGR02256 family)
MQSIVHFRPAELIYQLGESRQQLVIRPNVINHFERYQQRKALQPEAGGQLFARLSLDKVVIEKITGPRNTDFRLRTLYVPDRKSEQQEINRWHAKGLHYIGDWHTHPESTPSPSMRDHESIRDCFMKSTHHLLGFLLIIVGTAPLPKGLYVSLNNNERALPLVLRTEH